jgi:hypothetical protein
MRRTLRPPPFGHSNNIWRRVQVIKVHIFATSCSVHFLSLGIRIFSSEPLSSLIYVRCWTITPNKWTDVFWGIGRAVVELRNNVLSGPGPRNVRSTKWKKIFAGNHSLVCIATDHELEGRDSISHRSKSIQTGFRMHRASNTIGIGGCFLEGKTFTV